MTRAYGDPQKRIRELEAENERLRGENEQLETHGFGHQVRPSQEGGAAMKRLDRPRGEITPRAMPSRLMGGDKEHTCDGHYTASSGSGRFSSRKCARPAGHSGYCCGSTRECFDEGCEVHRCRTAQTKEKP